MFCEQWTVYVYSLKIYMGLNASYHYGILLLNRNKNIVLSAPSLQVDEYGNKLYSFRCFLATQMP